MKTYKLPSITLLNKAFFYERETGCLFWNFRNDRSKAWNSRFAHKEAGSLDNDGYVCVGINGRIYKAHRLIWAMVHGDIPDGRYIDHIDCNPSNNSLSNLRLASHSENLCNSPVQTNNKSGYKGVSWNRKMAKWVAVIRRNRRMYWLGGFHSPESAYEAYCNAALELHGDFARLE